MKARWTLKTRVPEDHKLQIQVPPEVPSGPATVAVEITPEQEDQPKSYLTAEDLLKSSIRGMRADREDLVDSSSFVQKLREEEEQRRGLRT